MQATTKRLPKVLGALGLAGGLALGAAGIAAAATGPSSSPSTPTSTAAADEKGDAALPALAKITPDQAKQAALAAVPGTVTKVALENENGSVVYGVEISANGTTTDGKIDAGNGKVLAQDSGA
ncbi:MAG: hypothetical protein QOH10_949, partial [Actinomycetota bacterium]|nr:hypothetical protein [Actinomycetota bacterium]